MKKRLRLAVIGAVVLLLAGIGGLVAWSMRGQWQREVAQSGLDLLPDVAQRIQDFHRVKTQDGHKVWEVAAREAQYLEDGHAVVVKEPLVRLYFKDGRAVGLSGHEGRVALDGRELSSVDLAGGIEVLFADYQLRTEQAHYEHAIDRISSSRPVEITGRGLELHGERMEVDVAAQKLRLFRNVTMTFQPNFKPDVLGHDAPQDPSGAPSASQP